MRMIEDKQINIPESGWKEHTWYRVNISMNANNPVFEGLLYTGFVNDGKPEGYSLLMSGTTPDETILYRELHYLEVVQELFTTS